MRRLGTVLLAIVGFITGLALGFAAVVVLLRILD